MRAPAIRYQHAALVISCAMTFAIVARANGTDPVVTLPASPVAAEPRAEQDDATLHAVQLVGSKLGWAVGDRGVVWKTADGGRSWQFQSTPVNGSLRDVCFLTDQIGWAAGGEVTPAGRHAGGFVLGTSDGGKTWSVLASGKLPYLFHVTFFGLENGVAVGAANPAFPNGVALTLDGGKTWQPAPGATSDGWRAAAFADEQTGSLAGRTGRFTTFGGGAVAERNDDLLGLRGLHAVDLQPDGRGWMVGDGGIVLMTTTAGTSWMPPPQFPPAAVGEFFDVLTVTSHDSHVWLAGAPGSAVWHSPDAGASWQSQRVSDPAPLHALDFSSATHGCAVGAFGRVLITDDGGQTWTPIRGGERRAAVLALTASAEQTPLRLLTKASAEEGYRSVALLTTRRDIGADAHLHADTDVYLHQAVISAGGNEGAITWNLPLAVPGLDRNYDRLLEQWSQLTDGKLGDVMLRDLVARLRTWRPEVIVIDEPSPDQAAARLLRQAIDYAVAQAADPQQYPEQQSLMYLAPWQVRRVCVRLPSGQSAEITIDPHELLPRQGRTLQMASSTAAACLGTDNRQMAENYKRILPVPAAGDPPCRGIFSGLSLAAGGDARRTLPPITEYNDSMEHLAQHQRNFAAWRDRALDDPIHAETVIAQLNDVLKTAPPDQAALQLAALADAYRQRAQWQLAEEAFTELAERYPNEPPAVDGMIWLLQMWTSQEIGWRRVQGVSASKQQISVRGEVAREVVNQSKGLLNTEEGRERLRALAQSANSPLAIQPTQATVGLADGENQRVFDTHRWLELASTVAADLQQRSPIVFAGPEVQFACAALYRQRENFQRSDEIYRAFSQNSDPVWQQAARGELWTLGSAQESPKPVIHCQRTSAPPALDGLLSDPCWLSATEISLTPEDETADSSDPLFVGNARSNAVVRASNTTAGGAIAMLSYDSEYLYFAASMPRVEGLATDPIVHAGRTHDGELQDHDRVSLLIDIDRDYATFYRLEVDSRGQTRDVCWTDESWNPQWYVANDADSRRWTIEAAIPLSELAPPGSVRGQFWGLGIIRTMPTVGVESWTHPTGATPRPATFGLMRMR